eukprot:TRINITY_DN10457_c0_g1_i1.p1 TRINITY_DN10457_c0_g1~~TRINITY_DN10457_c0_g1_i1.p1  ORF type:complete len:220 (-),score=18.75 TRINITY_DN10457_c0_g1_i1:271-930(-)
MVCACRRAVLPETLLLAPMSQVCRTQPCLPWFVALRVGGPTAIAHRIFGFLARDVLGEVPCNMPGIIVVHEAEIETYLHPQDGSLRKAVSRLQQHQYPTADNIFILPLPFPTLFPTGVLPRIGLTRYLAMKTLVRLGYNMVAFIDDDISAVQHLCVHPASGTKSCPSTRAAAATAFGSVERWCNNGNRWTYPNDQKAAFGAVTRRVPDHGAGLRPSALP